MDCVARGIRCVVRNWFWRLAGARGEIVCFGCWLARDVLGGARFLGAQSILIGVGCLVRAGAFFVWSRRIVSERFFFFTWVVG